MKIKKGDQYGWICIGKDHSDISRAGGGYEEVIGETYRWRSSLSNGRKINIGDIILIRDENTLIGASIIEAITISELSRKVVLCPVCNRAQVRDRPSKDPRYRCQQCRSAFDEPKLFYEVTEFRTAEYGAGWFRFPDNFLEYSEIKDSLAVKPNSQHSLQKFHLDKFEGLLTGLPKNLVAAFQRRNPDLHGGHVLRTVRTRIGQPAFRKTLFEKFGYVCAFTGPQPDAALEAAHLYQYAEEGKHHEGGGLFLRRDIHRLFDLGLLAVNPTTLLIDVDPLLAGFENYVMLSGQKLKVDLTDASRGWIALHWEQFRKI
jgi:hypothetical protein